MAGLVRSNVPRLARKLDKHPLGFPLRRMYLLIVAHMATNKRKALKLIELPPGRKFASAPPVLVASTHTVDCCCGACSAVLMHADEGQVHNLLIHCTECRRYNSTDS